MRRPEKLAEALKEEIAEVTNHVGDRVIVGHGTTLWGGKASTCVGIELHDDVRLFDGCRLVVDHLYCSELL